MAISRPPAAARARGLQETIATNAYLNQLVRGSRDVACCRGHRRREHELDRFVHNHHWIGLDG
jgi:hypothetical protein